LQKKPDFKRTCAILCLELDMNIGILYFSGNKKEKMKELAQGIAKGIEKQGSHTVQLIDAEAERDKKLTPFQYIALGAPGSNFFGGKIASSIPTFLQNAGIVSGKRCFAFTCKSGLRPMKTLQTIMKTMEHEGMYLKVSDILTTGAEAQAVGERLHVEH
jgi:hypothetical protein